MKDNLSAYISGDETLEISALTGLSDRQEIVRRLQKIEEILLNEYEVHIGDVTIEPLLIESYYHHPDYFPDLCVHAATGSKYAQSRQKNNFMKAYIHKPFKTGVDVCLSDSDNFYLSFLIKNARINNKFYTQFGVAEQVCVCKLGETCKQKVENCVFNEYVVLIERNQKKHSPIVYLPRKGVWGKFMGEPLAALPVEQIMEPGYDYTLPSGYSRQWRAAIKAIADGKTELEEAQAYIKEKNWCSSRLEEKYWKLAQESWKDSGYIRV